jgi:glycine hydroxymethyltransferase
MHVVAAKAVCFAEALEPGFKQYAAQVVANAKRLAEELARHGVRLISGGTDNHLILADVTPLGIGGKAAEQALDEAGITVNKNMVPFDTRKPMDPSGIRLGTPALTTRGMREDQMRTVGGWICQVLGSPDDPALRRRVREEVREFCADFPVPGCQVRQPTIQ